VHGREDMTVSARSGTLYDRRKETKTVVLDPVSHLYNATSADEDGYATFNRILALTSAWFHEQFNLE
jgi:hypothetical protein